MKTQIKHSHSKSAWNIVGTMLGDTYKLARIPYNVCGNESLDEKERGRALKLAEYIQEKLKGL